MSATARAMPTTMMPTRAFPARIIGPKPWKRRAFTSRRTAVSRRAFASGLNIGSSAATSCNKATATRVERRGGNREPRHVPGRHQRLLASAADELGTSNPHRHPDHCGDLAGRTRGQMGAAESDRPQPGAQEACDRHARRDDRERRRRGLSAAAGIGSQDMYQVDTSAYWQAQLMNWGPRILIAILIIVATWLVARAVKWVLQKAIDRSPALKKHVTGTPEETIGHQLGTIAKLIIWLVGIMAALRFLGIGQILAPINALTLEIFEFLPHLIAAGLIFFVGLVVARIVRRLVETVLIAANVDGLLARIGIGDTAGTVRTSPDSVPPGAAPGATRASLARAAGVLVYALIIIPVAIAALQALEISSIAGPATTMLNEILAAIPRVVAAALWI